MDDRPADASGYADNDGVELYWELHGDGPATVVLFGVPQASFTMESYRYLVPYLARHFRVLTWDIRGAGRSTAPVDPTAYSMSTAVADALAVLDATDVGPATFVGFSRSCRTVVHLAARHPERVLGSMLIAPAVVLPSVPVESDLDPEFASYIAATVAERPRWFDVEPEAQREWRFHDLLPTLERLYIEPYNLRAIEWIHDHIPDVDLRAQHAAFIGHFLEDQGDDEALVRAMSCPTLTINCTEDRIVQLPIGEAIAEWTGGSLITLEGSGHGPSGRDPLKVGRLIRDFAERTSGVPMPTHTWTRGQARRRRALFLTNPIGLGHTRRDMAVADELRRHHPDLEVQWLTEHPVTAALERAGEKVHPAARHLLSISDPVDDCCTDHHLDAFRVARSLDAREVANTGLVFDVLDTDQFDLVVADEGWGLDHHLHENPEQKRFAYAWMTDFVGWSPCADHQGESDMARSYNEQMLEQIDRYPRIRDLALFVGDMADIPPGTFGSGLPEVRSWTAEHYTAPGYVTGFEPTAVRDPHDTRRALGWSLDERVCVASVGGSGAGRALLDRVVASHPVLSKMFDRVVVVCGPRIDPAGFAPQPGLDLVGYIPDLPAVFNAADMVVTHGGLTATMELVALRKPFVYVPLQAHFEQQLLVPWRLDRYNAGRRVDYDRLVDPHEFAALVAAEAATDTGRYRPVASDGAAQAAAQLAKLL